ncbi:hypothetical protein [Pectobacterium carotovorum]|uniref:Uncharacterized protein n=1 Tax=Pectobacterium carotovorum subsp. carotovorum TaxID=555 RepID=A0AAI9KZJ2_PECCC|nr:hypothetical protein [Pectobacterium carotovorum]GKX46108.1 hypothetical protein SOASR016_08600 [Pectobacterium carotovorum subsp. carotovorum]GLV68412.1 hypothetical protein Pcaca03_08560 [Pectobacterium carotovorum subsp. carotovorum]
MIKLINHICRPFGYFNIKGISGKKAYDWYIPFGLTLISMSYFHVLGIPFNELSKDGGFIKTTVSFISNLPGFYIAALAAIATFNREQIDYPLIGENGDPFIEVVVTKENGVTVNSQEKLTRRLFLCMLFSFLAALSITIVMLNAFASPALSVFSNLWLHTVYSTVFIFLIWQLLVGTFFGLYYLGDRIHMNY